MYSTAENLLVHRYSAQHQEGIIVPLGLFDQLMLQGVATFVLDAVRADRLRKQVIVPGYSDITPAYGLLDMRCYLEADIAVTEVQVGCDDYAAGMAVPSVLFVPVLGAVGPKALAAVQSVPAADVLHDIIVHADLFSDEQLTILRQSQQGECGTL